MPVPNNCNGVFSLLNPGCWSGDPGSAPVDSAHPNVTVDEAAAYARASNGNAALYAATLNQAQSDQADLARQQAQDGWCTYTLGACDAVDGAFSYVAQSAKGAVATIAISQIALLGILGFALYKILSSDTARQSIVELVKAK